VNVITAITFMILSGIINGSVQDGMQVNVSLRSDIPNSFVIPWDVHGVYADNFGSDVIV